MPKARVHMPGSSQFEARPDIMNLTMFWRIMRRLVSGALAICGLLGTLLAGQGTKVQRDWSKNPAVIQVDPDQDLYVVGDPHADYDRLVGVLTGSKILSGPPTGPSNGSWN